MTDKFTEVKTLIEGGYYPQAKDECDNGVNMCITLENALMNIHSKLVDKFGADELLDDLQAVIETI